MGKKTSIYLTDELRAKLRVPARGPSTAVSATIERYDALIAPEKKRLVTMFTSGEWDMMRSACNSTEWTAPAIRGGVLAAVQDSVDAEMEYFGVDRSALEGKLAALSPLQQFALVEKLEEYGPIDTH